MAADPSRRDRAVVLPWQRMQCIRACALAIWLGAGAGAASAQLASSAFDNQIGAPSAVGGTGGTLGGGAGVRPAAGDAVQTQPGAAPVGTPTLRNGSGAVSTGPSSRSLAPEAQASGMQPAEQASANEFQNFVRDATGQSLPLFGYDFFQQGGGGGNPFAPAQATPVTADYPLGPGDELLIRGWGSIDVDVRATIDRNGAISIPRIGTIQLAGVRASQAEGVVRTAVGRIYRDFELSVTLGQLRSITVYLVGQSRRPGAYNLSSVSTLVSALFASGGPSAVGSLRRIQLKRGNATVTEIDLYSFLAAGNKAADVRLLDGDVIVIPPAAGYVALAGKVTSPAVYELRDGNESLESLLAVAGGVPIVADPRRVVLERIEPGRAQSRKVEDFPLDAAGLRRTLRSGDLLTVLSINPEFSNAVTLRGIRRLPWREGMRVRDLIPSAELLLTRGAIQRQNGALRDARDDSTTLAQRIGNVTDEINMEYAVIERVDRRDLSVQLIPFHLGRVLADANDVENRQLVPGDIVTVFSINDVRVPLSKRRVFVRVEGEVARPGVYQATPDESLVGLIERAGGLTREAYLYGAGYFRDEVRRNQSENLERLLRRLEAESTGQLTQTFQSLGATSEQNMAAVQARLQAAQQAQRAALERVRAIKPTGRIALGLPADTSNVLARLPSLRLENGDQLVIPSRPDYVYVFGAVNVESALVYRPGASVSHYLDQAGVSNAADRGNVILMRADGSAQTNTSAWGNATLSAVVMPGDTVILPEKIDRESTWSFVIRNAKDITQVFYQLGLGAAGIKVLRDN